MLEAGDGALQRVLTWWGPFATVSTMRDKQRCPRRDEIGQQGGAPTEQPDTWRVRGRNDGGLGDKVRTCSYCGSMNPDDLMEMLEAGTCVIGPTDKNYKAYIEEALTDEQLAKVEAEVDAEIADLGPEHHRENHRANTLLMRNHGPSIAKFYYMHLSEPQRQRYFELFKEDKIKYGYPGYAYTLPFFIGRAR